MVIEAFREGKEMIEEFQERITGRYLAESVYDAEGNMLVKINHMVTAKRAELIVNKGVDSNGVPFTVTDENGERKVRLDAKIKIRTVLTCKSHLGVCAKCYGANMATTNPSTSANPSVSSRLSPSANPAHSLRCVHSIRAASQLLTLHRVFPVSRSCLKQESRRRLPS